MYEYLLYFLIFSFLGWCLEVAFHLLKCGKLVNRGLAYGPFCPIYGVGVCLSRLLLGSVENFFALFLLCMAVATAVEFAVGLILDKTLGRRLWDYSSVRGNLSGYVCPSFSVAWGIIGALVVKFLPRFDPYLERLHTPLFMILTGVAVSLLILDISLSAVIKSDVKSLLSRFKKENAHYS